MKREKACPFVREEGPCHKPRGHDGDHEAVPWACSSAIPMSTAPSGYFAEQPDARTAAMVTALRYARDHRSAVPRSAFDYDEWARLVDAAIGPRDPAAKVPDTFDLEAARLAIGEG